MHRSVVLSRIFPCNFCVQSIGICACSTLGLICAASEFDMHKSVKQIPFLLALFSDCCLDIVIVWPKLSKLGSSLCPNNSNISRLSTQTRSQYRGLKLMLLHNRQWLLKQQFGVTTATTATTTTTKARSDQ